ncbi:MAG: helix-turn-helix domain-containing protein, partial [Planctomycetota bacterium]
MKIYKAFKFRLYPNKKQQRSLGEQFGSCRWVWNYF